MKPSSTPPSTVNTLTESSLPWRKGSGTQVGEGLHLVVVWSLEEPERIGEVAAISGTSILGRGAARAEDPIPRLMFVQHRPGTCLPMAELCGSRISRVQLQLTELNNDEVEVKNVGKCSLLHNGQRAQQVIARQGDTLTLRNAMMFLVVRRKRAIPVLRYYPSTMEFPFGFRDKQGIVGESPAAWELRDMLAFAAQSNHHVLLQGESGVGKELAARALQSLSERSNMPLVARNAATFPESLVDAELFGTAKNFPNAGMPERLGLIGEADRSTLFLDEIGELPQQQQAHLLRVLDNGGEYQRLGESRTRKSDFRLVAATNRSLDELKYDFVARFTTRVHIPGLEARREDIPLLIRMILQRASESQPSLKERFFEERPGDTWEARVDPKLIDAFLRHQFTYHSRELERLLWLAISTTSQNYIELTSEVQAELQMQEPENIQQPSSVTKEDVQAALADTGGSATLAAKKLGLKNRFVLYRLLKKFEISPSSGDDDSRKA
jgi:transcriptional regulator with PAS, ATPase and Fis domain